MWSSIETTNARISFNVFLVQCNVVDDNAQFVCSEYIFHIFPCSRFFPKPILVFRVHTYKEILASEFSLNICLRMD